MAEEEGGTAGLFDPRLVLEVNDSPVQRPTRDRLLKSAVVGGPSMPGDRRIYLSRELLGRVLDVARASLMGRALLDHAGVRVDLYERPDGHRYEIWTLIGIGPKPEQVPEFVATSDARRDR